MHPEIFCRNSCRSDSEYTLVSVSCLCVEVRLAVTFGTFGLPGIKLEQTEGDVSDEGVEIIGSETGEGSPSDNTLDCYTRV